MKYLTIKDTSNFKCMAHVVCPFDLKAVQDPVDSYFYCPNNEKGSKCEMSEKKEKENEE